MRRHRGVLIMINSLAARLIRIRSSPLPTTRIPFSLCKFWYGKESQGLEDQGKCSTNSIPIFPMILLNSKQHKLPEQKFLVVTKPWGVYNNFDDADFNHIGAWFDRMLKGNQDTRIKAIYYQKTVCRSSFNMHLRNTCTFNSIATSSWNSQRKSKMSNRSWVRIFTRKYS